MASDGMSTNSTHREKSRRVSRACDYCHRRSIRCRPSGDGISCQNCREFGQPCTFERQAKRRGVPARPRPARAPPTEHAPSAPSPRLRSPAQSSSNNTPPIDETRHLSRHSVSSVRSQAFRDARKADTSPTINETQHRALPGKWRAPYVASQATVMDLVELYFEIVYPIFPLYHQPSFMRSISRGEFNTKRTLFATTMAVCALVSARARDSAVFNPRWDVAALQEVDSEVFYAEAILQSADDDIELDHNLMRAHAVLALCAIQYGKIRDMHRHLGRYHTFVAMDGLHDEENWPQTIGIVETEERRRLFWSIYTLDIYSSVVWGGVIRCREQQSNVSYPTEVDDELFDDTGFSNRVAMSPVVIGPSPSRNGVQVQSNSWLSGWNFVTDLYRVLEHVITHFRDRRSRARKRSFLHDIFGDQSAVSQSSVRESVMRMYIDLPQCFKETPAITCDIKQDRFGFQAANITATIQLLRMVLFAAGGASIEERCQIANEVVGAFASVPAAYLQAISSPLMHHLGGIGSILGSVFEEPLCEVDYSRVRSVMLAMAQLLANLEGMHSSASASERLRSQVARVDEYMSNQRNAVARQQHNLPPSIQQTLQADHDLTGDLHFGAFGTSPGDTSAMSSFQVPADVLGDFTWMFDFAQPMG